jgi:hypothetical protein
MLGSDLGEGVGKGFGVCCTAKWGNEGKWGKCDLKTGHGRSSSSAFDRT